MRVGHHHRGAAKRPRGPGLGRKPHQPTGVRLAHHRSPTLGGSRSEGARRRASLCSSCRESPSAGRRGGSTGAKAVPSRAADAPRSIRSWSTTRRLCLYGSMHWVNSCKSGGTALSRSWRQTEQTTSRRSRPGRDAAPAVAETSMMGDGRMGGDQLAEGADAELLRDRRAPL